MLDLPRGPKFHHDDRLIMPTRDQEERVEPGKGHVMFNYPKLYFLQVINVIKSEIAVINVIPSGKRT